jgi:hypothetical protein
MIPRGYSTYVIYSCFNMSYAPRQSRAQSKTFQSCSGSAAAVLAFTRRRLPYGVGQRPLAAPGLSLSATSSASEAAASGQRYQSRFHREAFSQIGKAGSDSCPGGRLVLERVREAGVSGATNAETTAWLSGVHSAASFSSNILFDRLLPDKLSSARTLYRPRCGHHVNPKRGGQRWRLDELQQNWTFHSYEQSIGADHVIPKS